MHREPPGFPTPNLTFDFGSRAAALWLDRQAYSGQAGRQMEKSSGQESPDTTHG